MIDSFYRIKALGRLGIRIDLHCFEYGRPHSSELEEFCESVSYYSRATGPLTHLSGYPYVVCSRRSKDLFRDILLDDYPILFDGLHTTYYLDHPELAGRMKIVRVHNIEHRYYRNLEAAERNPFRKLFYRKESFKLELYEEILRKADKLLAISPAGHEYFNARYGNAELVLPFHPFEKVESRTGSGRYVLYHGDLSVNENLVIAELLVSEVFSHVALPCIIAGKNPPADLAVKASPFNNISIVANPDESKMSELIREAHINILPALSSEGMKLRLLFALFSGRHCIANSMIAGNTGLESLCHIADTPAEMTGKIQLLMNQDFTYEMIREREKVLCQMFSNKNNAEKIFSLIFATKTS